MGKMPGKFDKVQLKGCTPFLTQQEKVGCANRAQFHQPPQIWELRTKAGRLRVDGTLKSSPPDHRQIETVKTLAPGKGSQLIMRSHSV